MQNYNPTTSIILPYEEFQNDENNKLGRANGNTYQRKPGIENVNDGQIMVRLKKKRFIILDYSYVPTRQDIELAKQIPHVVIPKGAGVQLCATKDCQRVGVPIMLYDSDPNEPSSLYLRGGLCFSCQRNLNEKRRTNRKRKKPEDEPVGVAAAAAASGDSEEIFHPEEFDDRKPPPPALNRVKANGEFIELNSDAIIINGPVEGTRTRGPTYQFGAIGNDILRHINDLNQEASTLLANNQMLPPSMINQLYEKTFLSLSKATFLLTQWKASYDEAVANNFAMNAGAQAVASLDTQLDQALDQAVAAAAALAGNGGAGQMYDVENGNDDTHVEV